MTPEFFIYPEGQGFLTCDGGSVTALGGLTKGSGDKIKNQSKSNKSPTSFMEEFFNNTSPSDVEVDASVIVISAYYPRELKCEGFVKNGILFLKGSNLSATEELKDGYVTNIFIYTDFSYICFLFFS